MNNSTKKHVQASHFLSIRFEAANIKEMRSISFDALPAFLGTMVLGVGWGALIGAVGHLLTALTSGFPYGLPAHIVIAVMMGVTMAAFLLVINLFQRLKAPELVSYVAGGLAAVLINGPGCVFLLFPVLGAMMGKEALLALIPVLSLVGAANVALAVVVYRVLPKAIRKRGKVYRDAHETADNH